LERFLNRGYFFLKSSNREMVIMLYLPNRQRQRLLRNTTQGIGDLKAEAGLANSERRAADRSASNVKR
jgi:hypothetical protein